MRDLNYWNILAHSQEDWKSKIKDQQGFSPVPMSFQGVCVLIPCSYKNISQIDLVTVQMVPF